MALVHAHAFLSYLLSVARMLPRRHQGPPLFFTLPSDRKFVLKKPNQLSIAVRPSV